MIVPLINFIRPNARQIPAACELPSELDDKVKAILSAGLRFTCELDGLGKVILCIENNEEDLVVEIADNGPGENSPAIALERMIRKFKLEVG